MAAIPSSERSSSVPLYADDSYLREFEAEVVKAGPKFVILDRTAFYPESGGQPSDTGAIIYGGREIRVRKVMKRGWDIYHYTAENIPTGVSIIGVIDWEPRFFNMRRHSAEHLLTGLFEDAGAGPKVYSDLERLEFKPSNLNQETVDRVGAQFDEIVDQDLPVRIYYEDREELDVGGDERKREFLEKIPSRLERLRMVDISGHALTFCFGTHVRSTGELGHLASLELVEHRKLRKTVRFILEEIANSF
ncbi:MAG: alanyl-tRNA editing protein [Candidatus Bathyarchaeota archaeon]|jgi:Ser-tRNA(Ala) deacylase AlaX